MRAFRMLAVVLAVMTLTVGLVHTAAFAAKDTTGDGFCDDELGEANGSFRWYIEYSDGTFDYAGDTRNGVFIPPWCDGNDVPQQAFHDAGYPMHAIELHVSCSDPGLFTPGEEIKKSDLGGKTQTDENKANSFIIKNGEFCDGTTTTTNGGDPYPPAPPAPGDGPDISTRTPVDYLTNGALLGVGLLAVGMTVFGAVRRFRRRRAEEA